MFGGISSSFIPTLSDDDNGAKWIVTLVLNDRSSNVDVIMSQYSIIAIEGIR
jgi:hypothetical protein